MKNNIISVCCNSPYTEMHFNRSVRNVCDKCGKICELRQPPLKPTKPPTIPSIIERVLASNPKQSKEYARIHYFLRSKYGKPEYCESKECMGRSKIYDWALKKGRSHYPDRENYMRMCRSCHIKYDWTTDRSEKATRVLHSKEVRDKVAISLTGRKRPEEYKKKMRDISWVRPVLMYKGDDFISKFRSMTEAAESIGANLNGIWLVLKGINKTCKGYKFEYEFPEILKQRDYLNY